MRDAGGLFFGHPRREVSIILDTIFGTTFRLEALVRFFSDHRGQDYVVSSSHIKLTRGALLLRCVSLTDTEGSCLISKPPNRFLEYRRRVAVESAAASSGCCLEKT